MLRKLLLASTALVVAAALALPAAAQGTPIRIVSKDLLSTNPPDVAHIQRIEDALNAQGLNVDLQIVDLPSATYADALGVMLLSGDIPDLIYFQGGDAKMADQGILEDLNPWIEQSPNLKAALWPHNVERLSNYPYLLYVYPPRAPQPVIRTDWLEKLGMAAPTTVDEYEAFFQAIHDADLDGDGTPGNTMGVTTADNTNELDSIFNQAFGITGTWMQNEAGEWIHARISNQERDKLAWYAELAAKGLYDKEYITSKFDVKEDKFYTGKAGVIFGSSAEVIDIYGGKMRQAHPDEDISLTLLPIPSGPGGQGLAAVDVSKEARGFAIATTSPNKELVAKILDFMASTEGQMMDRMGFEGTEYTKTGDTYEITDAMSTWYARFFAASNFVPPVEWKSEAAQQSLKNIQQYFKPDNAFVWPAEYAADLDAAENVYRAWVYKFISGEASMDQWDQYVAEWKAAGGDKLTSYAVTVLDPTN
jgi:putative aldouronate transport system substrate-binding protein